MNKTAILSFIIDEVALKCRNVSINMRKRIQWMLKNKKITVRKYDVRALVLNGWIRVRKDGVWISKVEEMKKGVFNYKLETQEHLDKLISLNNEIRCQNLYFTPADPIEIESIEDIRINTKNYEIYSKCSFNKAKYLLLKQLSTDQIKLILTRFKTIDRLEIYDCSLQSLDFSSFRIKQIEFSDVALTKPVRLPKEIVKLDLLKCRSPSLIEAQRVNKVYFSDESGDQKELKVLAETLKGVKFARVGKSLKEYLTSFPSTVRKIVINEPCIETDNLEEIFKHFPYLMDINVSASIEALDKTKLRVISPIMNETGEKYNLRPREIEANSKNVLQLNNHPELFERVEWVCIESDKFNFDVLPSEIKRIKIYEQVDEESVTLNSLEKERE